ncbi:Tn3 family transposase [Persicobacter psychrovividus]|uniref:Tn3 family transposase n=1 Tax=Persicobacter psychrovividus TaxID=387638 RepID=A0ABM7VMX0_9BACT|nr:hypothetical protein PEPS_46390 [Persicobacter psychrovividus]
MAIAQRTVYPVFDVNYSEEDLRSVLFLNDTERRYAEDFSRDANTQAVFLLLLKAYLHLGYFPKVEQVPDSWKFYLETSMERSVHWEISDRLLRKIQAGIRQFLKVKPYAEGGQECVRELVKELAMSMADPADLINASVEQLQRHGFVLPSFETLHRLVYEVRKQVHLQLFEMVENRLSEQQRKDLDALLMVQKGELSSPFTRLKDFPAVAKLSEIKAWMARWYWLESLLEQDPLLEGIRYTKIENFGAQAYAYELSNMRGISDDGKRHTLLLSLLYVIKRKTKDELVDMLIRRMRTIHFRGRQKLETLKEQQRSLQELMLQTFAKIVEDAKQEKDPKPLGQKVKNRLAMRGGLDYFDECMQLLTQTHGQNYYPLLWAMHQPYRKVLLDLVEVLNLSSATSDNVLIECIERYMPLRHQRRQYIDDQFFRLDFLSQKWRNAIEVQQDGQLVYDRKMLELALLTQLSEALQTTDIFVPASMRYGDYRQQMIGQEEVEELVPDFCKEIELPETAEDFVSTQKEALRMAIETLDDAVKGHESVWIDEQGKIRLRRKKRPKPDQQVIEFQRKVRARLQPVSLLDLLHQGNQWTDYTQYFQPVSGNEAKSSQNKLHQIYTLFAFGSNLGAYQTAKHTTQPISRRVMDKMNYQQIDADKLQQGIGQVIDHFQAFKLPAYWGQADTAVADGTHIPLSENNLMGERHIRYGGYGGIAYHHISDTYVAMFSKFIACGTWEAVHILDGLMNHQSKLNPTKVHADTQGQNEPAFGLAYLLGIELMPRIRNLKDLTLYKVAEEDQYKTVNEVFTKSIDWQLIQTHWKDLMQVAISISKGKIALGHPPKAWHPWPKNQTL